MAAVAFTPSVTTPFSHADFALSYCTDVAQGITGAANLDVTLAADAGGFPGHPIETIHTTNAFNSQCTAAVLTAASSLQPNLVKGVQYWLIVSPPDLLHTQFFWLIGPAGAPNTLAPGQFLLQLNLPASSFKYASVGNGLMGFNPPFAVFGGSPVTAATAVAANGVVSAASYTAPVSGGSWTAVFGTAFSLTSRGWRSRDFDSTQLPVSLDNVSVIVGGIPTAVSYISPGQVNVQFPDVPSWSFLALQVISPQDASAPIMVQAPAASPALFTTAQNGVSYAAATQADGTLITPSQPAQPGATSLFMELASGLRTRPPPQALSSPHQRRWPILADCRSLSEECRPRCLTVESRLPNSIRST